MWIANSIWHSLCCFFIPMATFGFMNGSLLGGKAATLEEIGILIYTCIIFLVNAKLALETSTWNFFNTIVLWGSVAVWFLWTICYSVFYWVVPPLDFFPFKNLQNLGIKYYFNFYTSSGDALFWLAFVLVIMVALMRDIAWKSAVRILPWTQQLYHIIQPYSKVNTLAPRDYVESMFDFTKLQAPQRKPYDKFNRIGIYITPGAPLSEIEKYEPHVLERKKTLNQTNFGTGYAFSQRDGGENDLIKELYSPSVRSGQVTLQTLDKLELEPSDMLEEETTDKQSKRQMKKEMKSKLTTGKKKSLGKKKDEVEDLDDEVIAPYDIDMDMDDIDIKK